MFDKILFSPQVKRSIFISNKHGMYELLHVLSNDSRLKIQGQGVHHIEPFDMKPRASPKYPVHDCNSRPDRNIPPDTHRSHPLPIHHQKLLDPQKGFDHFFFFFFLFFIVMMLGWLLKLLTALGTWLSVTMKLVS